MVAAVRSENLAALVRPGTPASRSDLPGRAQRVAGGMDGLAARFEGEALSLDRIATDIEVLEAGAGAFSAASQLGHLVQRAAQQLRSGYGGPISHTVQGAGAEAVDHVLRSVLAGIGTLAPFHAWSGPSGAGSTRPRSNPLARPCEEARRAAQRCPGRGPVDRGSLQGRGPVRGADARRRVPVGEQEGRPAPQARHGRVERGVGSPGGALPGDPFARSPRS